jgi:hypothetical protein
MRLAGGYISCKIPPTPTHTRYFSKRQKTIVTTPLKTPQQTKSVNKKKNDKIELRIFKKNTKKQRNIQIPRVN